MNPLHPQPKSNHPRIKTIRNIIAYMTKKLVANFSLLLKILVENLVLFLAVKLNDRDVSHRRPSEAAHVQPFTLEWIWLAKITTSINEKLGTTNNG